MIRILAILGALIAIATQASAQVTVTGQLDVNALVGQGQASITASSYDIGSPSNLFDGDLSTLYRSASVNPAQVTVAFQAARTFDHFAAKAGGSDTGFRVETADSISDLDAKSGSYALILDWTTAPDQTLTTLTPTAPHTAKVVRLTAHRLYGDDYVHLYEWRIFSAVTVTDLSVNPGQASAMQGQQRTFRASGSANDGTTPDLSGSVLWSSLNPDIASVDAKGVATAKAAGRATIRATLDTLHADAFLDVNNEPADLDVTYIQRTPRYDFDAAKNNPAPGDPVTFNAHVKLWGGTSLTNVAYRWELDGQSVQTGTIASFAAGSEQVLTLPWTWQAGNHTVGFFIDTDNAVSEVSEVNNSLVDRVNAIMAGFWVEQTTYNYFHEKQRNLGVGSNSWEDWIQRQMAKQNELYAKAVWPNAPNGVLDRVRIDEIIVVPDGALPLAGGLPTNDPDFRDKTIDLMWGFPATSITGGGYQDTTSAVETNPFFIEQSLIHELGHARYLIDCYGFDVHNTYNPSTGQGYDAVQILENGKPVAGTSLMPFIAWGEVLYYNKSGGVMSGPYGFQWSPYEAGALNLIAGRRAKCGNYNAPCNIGEYLQDLPLHNHVRFVDSDGWPVSGADVKLYQAEAGYPAGWYGKTYDNTPDLSFTTDVNGYADMPRNPFSSGDIVNDYGHANGVAILRVQHPSGLWYRFMEVSDFNIAYWTGHTQDAYYTITLPGAHGSPSPADAIRALEISAGLRAAETADVPHLDADHSGALEATDAATLLRQAMGL